MNIKLIRSIIIVLAVICPFLLSQSCSAITTFGEYTYPGSRLTGAQSEIFPQNDLTFWNPYECEPGPGGGSKQCNPPTGDQITWIGDSYSVFVDNQGLINEKFSGADIGPSPNNTASSYIQGSKAVGGESNSSNPKCLDILQNIIDAGKLRPYLVFACGTNGGWSDDDVSRFQNLIKDKDVKAVVVNSRFKACYPGISCDPTFADSNSKLKAMADSNDKITLADWASAYNEDYFKTDPVHPYDDPGGEKWIETIASALPQDCDNGDLLPGANIAEKIWNGLVSDLNNRNLSGKNISAIVSGIMGNFYVESGLNPLMASDGYYGLYMLYGAYGGSGYVSKINSAIGDGHVKFYGWWENENTADQQLKDEGLSTDQISEAIGINLKVLTESSEYNEFIDGVKNWGVADTADGYSDLFLVTVERATPGDSAVEDAAVRSHYGSSYQKPAERREWARHFYDKYASSTSINPTIGSVDSPTTPTSAGGSGETSGGSTSGDGKNYAGEVVWDEDQMALVNEYKPVYQAAADQYGLPWQAIATVHRLETSMSLENPGNGQGLYQLYSYTDGGSNSNSFPAGPVDTAEFQRQTNIAAEQMKGIIEGGGYSANSEEGIKFLIFSYNGRASQYIEKALAMGFSQAQADVGEGSPYVMNKYDARRDPNSSEMDPNWPGRYVDDGVYDSSSTMYDFGGFVLYAALGGASTSGGSTGDNICGGGGGGGGGADASGLAAYVLKYAWPDYHSGPYTDRMPDYADAVTRRSGEGKYVGGTVCGVPGIDCGGFVTTLLQESGFDPDYGGGGNTYSQESYVANSSNWELVNSGYNVSIGDESQLSPGDVAFTSCGGSPGACEHTYVYVGEIRGFNSHIASASYSGCDEWARAPMAGTEAIVSSGVNWYHKVR